jgi:hypothetical protein
MTYYEQTYKAKYSIWFRKKRKRVGILVLCKLFLGRRIYKEQGTVFIYPARQTTTEYLY